MIFKNAVIFKFTKEFPRGEAAFDELVDRLQDESFTPPHETQESSFGWVEAIPSIGEIVFESNDCLFLRLRKDQKILKESAIKREVEDIARGIERDQGRKVRKNEKQEIRDTVIARHLPNALIDSTYTVGYIDLAKQWLVVDASTFKAAEDFASVLRKTLGSLPVRPLALENNPGMVLTATLDPEDPSAHLRNEFTLGEECTMADVDGGTARFKDVDLTSEEVVNHITESGMTVTSLRLSREDQLAFTLTDDFRVKKIKVLDQFQEDVLNYEPEDEDIDAGLSYARANLFLMTGQFRNLFELLIMSMGGEEESFDPLEDFD
ncbi:recombination-associated protein RdgC [Marinobacter nauticus]|uniref:Recombination-associated protein RdgC n=1 Tax=Marinobacter nauticus TaxID=2743 RepID=A0A833N9S9_MARNT|nr:recombination-associated protein RdgC [Marinobacter nauticus]KAE8546127.1 DNA recombination-dependent growth factor RdgC [Marinobacter nauticus]